jgi:hypothetical protein
MPRVPSPRRDLLAALVALALAVAMLLGIALEPAAAAPSRRAVRVDLSARADFVAQTNLVQCVGASTQMMLNMIGTAGERDRTATTQLVLQRIARRESGPRPDGTTRRGASVFGWAKALTMTGGGNFHVVGAATIGEALLIAARAMQSTGRPVGLLMWRGRHAWVMSGFHATADPFAREARVTSVNVEDPLYPRDSRTWGPSPSPGSALTVAQLARQFVPRRQSARSPALSGKYVVVVPYEPRTPFHDWER